MADLSPAGDDSFSALTEEEESRVREIQERIDPGDLNTVMQFGTAVQGKIADFADAVLSEVRARDTDYVGKILGELMMKIKELHVDSLDGGFLSKIPFVKPFLDKAGKFMAGYRDISVQIVSIVAELEKARAGLLRDVATLDQFYEKNVEYYRDLNLFILAGKMKLMELRETVIPGLEEEAKSGDHAAIRKYKDMEDLVERLEKKLHDLVLSRTVSLQTAPQIRLVQNNNRELAEKIQSSILNAVPLWKSQVVIAISLLRQKNIVEVQRQVSETTGELLLKNAEMIRESSAGVAREAERGIVDVETLKKVNAELIGTIDETMKIQEEGRLRRRQAEEEIEKVEMELKDALMKIKDMKGKKTGYGD